LEEPYPIIIDHKGSQSPKIELKKKWSFMDAVKRNGYVLNSSCFVFHTSNYHTFDVFADKFLKGLKLLHGIVKLDYIERVGMRYIDVISPKKGQPIRDYLRDGVKGLIDVEEDGFLSTDGASAQKIGDGILVIKTSLRPNCPPFLIPDDLMPLHLLPSEDSSAEETMTRATLDVDFYEEKRFNFNIDPLMEKLKFAHEHVEKAFHLAVTDYALNEWR
jgi:uncharacterized protein (TIGR04255 family)